MGQLDASIVTVAFPTLQRVFHADVESVTWVGLSYLIVLVAGVTAVGRVSDMVGRKLLYCYGFVVFMVGSGLCALAPTLVVLDGFRVIQGLGAAMLQANSVAIIYLIMPRERLGEGHRHPGCRSGPWARPRTGRGWPVAGRRGWRLIFFVNVPAGIVGIAAAWVFLPRSRDLHDRTPFDWIGLGLFIPAIAALLVTISFGSQWGWTSPATVSVLTLAVSTGAGFVVHERRCTDPMLDFSLLRRAPFATGIASGLLAYAVLFGTMFVVPFFLERARGASPGEVGLTLCISARGPWLFGSHRRTVGRASRDALARCGWDDPHVGNARHLGPEPTVRLALDRCARTRRRGPGSVHPAQQCGHHGLSTAIASWRTAGGD